MHFCLKGKQQKEVYQWILLVFMNWLLLQVRQENTCINAQENESRVGDIFVLILDGFFQKRPRTAFKKIKTTRRAALFLSAFRRLAAAGSLKKLASIKASVSFPLLNTEKPSLKMAPLYE